MNLEFIKDKLKHASARLAECRQMARTCPNDNINLELMRDYEEEVRIWSERYERLEAA